MNSRLFGILTAIVAAIVIGALVFLNNQNDSSEVTAPVVAATPTSTPAPERPKEIAVHRPDKVAPEIAAEPEEGAEKPPGEAPKLAPWEIQIDQALRANAEETQTAQMLINMLPTLPKEGQTEAAQHITNLILDKDYNRIAPLLKNPGLNAEVLEVFFTDLMNRENEVKLPMLLAIAKVPNHPQQQEALSDLQIFIDEDHGTDWAKWESAMQSFLKRTAAEDAAADALVPGGVRVPQ